IEKPKVATTSAPLCGIGVYLFHKDFLTHIARFEPEPTSLILALNHFAKKSQVSVSNIRQEFLPLKYPGHLWHYARYLGIDTELNWNVLGAGQGIVSRGCILEPGVELSNVILAPDVFIGSGTRTVGRDKWNDLDAVVIGEGATIGEKVTLEAGVRIG